jgi:alpha-galactosidase/6-phospho-beta-glucosidase family protein
LDSVAPLATGALCPVLVSSLIQHCLAQELTVEGSLKGDRRLIIEAMLTQPHIVDFATVEAMVEEMIQAQKQWLPRFF